MIFFYLIHDHSIKMTAILLSLEFTVHIPYLTIEVNANFQILKSSHQCLHLHISNSFRSNGVSARMPIKGCAMDLLQQMIAAQSVEVDDEDDDEDKGGGGGGLSG